MVALAASQDDSLTRVFTGSEAKQYVEYANYAIEVTTLAYPYWSESQVHAYVRIAIIDAVVRNPFLDGPLVALEEHFNHLADTMGGPQCFPASTPVATSLTDTRPISDIRAGDTVLAFDPSADLGRGALVPRKVTRLYRNTTEEWIRLSWREEGEEKELVTTPGHHFLDRFGNFPMIEEMLAQGRAMVVLASGELTEVTAERIIYSAETAHLFEQAQAEGVVAGSAALKPAPIDAWQTYNFEVEDLHIYVAGGVRVHNQSGWVGLFQNAHDRQAARLLGSAG